MKHLHQHFKKYSRVKIAALLIAAIGLVLLLFSVKNLLIQVGLFIFCLVFMVKFGQFFILDVDPIPFCAFLLLALFDFKVAINFLLWALPITDILSSRFNHFTVINFASIVLTILFFSISPFLKGGVMIYGVIVFNVIRSMVALLFDLGPQMIAYNAIHAIIYFILGSLANYFL